MPVSVSGFEQSSERRKQLLMLLAHPISTAPLQDKEFEFTAQHKVEKEQSSQNSDICFPYQATKKVKGQTVEK